MLSLNNKKMWMLPTIFTASGILSWDLPEYDLITLRICKLHWPYYIECMGQICKLESEVHRIYECCRSGLCCEPRKLNKDDLHKLELIDETRKKIDKHNAKSISSTTFDASFSQFLLFLSFRTIIWLILRKLYVRL